MVKFGKLLALGKKGARMGIAAGLNRVGGVDGAIRLANSVIQPRLASGIQAVAGYKRGGVIVVKVVKKRKAAPRRRRA